MARVIPLFSSSEGNATYIGGQDGGILVDAGVTSKRLVEALHNHGISPNMINGIFVTHEHSDHIRGLKTFTKAYDIPVYAQKLNLTYLIDSQSVSSSCSCIEVDGEMQCGEFSVSAFETLHDTRQSCGYRIKTSDDKIICICTDLGTVTQNVHENIAGADLVLLESNYDSTMLRNGSYPYMLKKRIASEHGHLDNSDCSDELVKLVKSGTTRLILGHLSQHNNLPSIAEASAVNNLTDKGIRRGSDYLLMVAPVRNCGEVVTL